MAIPIPDVSLIDNSDERAPLVLVLDCSGSMDGVHVAIERGGQLRPFRLR
jgi:hypothetical protein